MGEPRRRLELEQRPANEAETAPPTPLDELQLRRPDRRQITYARIDVERLVAGLQTRLGQDGRPAWDPRLLAAIWIWAYSEGIASARELERQSHYGPEVTLIGCDLSSVDAGIFDCDIVIAPHSSVRVRTGEKERAAETTVDHTDIRGLVTA